jgi:hypothetical protein
MQILINQKPLKNVEYFNYFISMVTNDANICTVWRRELQLTSPHSTHYRHTRHMLPQNHDGEITLFKYFNNF